MFVPTLQAILFNESGTMLQEMSIKDVGTICRDSDIEFPGFLVRVDSEEQIGEKPISIGNPSARMPSIASVTGSFAAKRRPFSNPRRKDGVSQIQISSQAHSAKPPDRRRGKLCCMSVVLLDSLRCQTLFHP